MSTATQYPRHPISAAFPIVPASEAAEHIDSIRETGLIDDIVLLDGQVLDGWNRQLWCEAAGVEPRYRDFGSRPSDGACPATFAMALNLSRRHMSVGERQAAAAELMPFFQAEAGLGRMEATEAIADKFEISPRSVQAAVFVKENDPAALEEVKEGKTTVTAAEKKTRGKKAAAAAPANSNPALDMARAQAAEVAAKHHTAVWAEALGNGTALKTATELDTYVNMSVEEQTAIIPLLRKGWKIARAKSFLARDPDCNERVELLILRAVCAGKTLKVAVDGYQITVKKM